MGQVVTDVGVVVATKNPEAGAFIAAAGVIINYGGRLVESAMGWVAQKMVDAMINEGADFYTSALQQRYPHK
ncbi:MAG TPA: hypothetical protein VG962_13400 [Steroidobacteraceae bacterium]|nr:hypothetical protein [Steroidobacteraceae bacterium]